MSDDDALDDHEGAAPLSPEDESAVHDLLAALPDPELPLDVERRITEALGTNPGDTVPAGPPETRSSTTVLAASPSAPSANWRHPRLLQAAAVLVILALVGAVTAGIVTSQSGSGGSSVTATESLVGPITTSGTNYTAGTLPGQVLGLLGGADSAAAAPQAAAAEGEANPAAALVENQATREACIAELAGKPGVTQVAIDVGQWSGKPAAIIVLPNENNPEQVDVWVVGQTCSDADNPFPYHYARVTPPR